MYQGVNPKWYSHFPNGKYYKDDGRSDEDFWAEQDERVAEEQSKWGVRVQTETPEEIRDRVLREMGF